MKRALLPALVLLSACSFDEQLPEIDITGTIRVPREAAVWSVVNEDGSISESEPDPRYIGPVWLGAYAAVESGILDFPHPEMGPILNTDSPGECFPYGGTSVGRYAFGCFPSVACQVVTGRFSTFDDIIDYFQVIEEPVTDPYGEEVVSGKYYEQYCLDYFHVSTLQELPFLAIDEEGNPDLEFTEDPATGEFVAEFRMPHTVWHEGMQIWGWVDQLDTRFRSYSSCNETFDGNTSYEYNLDFDAGGAYGDILNYPWLYIQEGDWVVSNAFTMQTPDDQPELVLDFHYE